MVPPVKRFAALDLETVPDEALVGAVDGVPSRPYPEQLQRLVDARRQKSGGRSDFLPLPYHRPIAACGVEACEDGEGVTVADVWCWTDRAGEEGAFLADTWRRLHGRTLVSFHGRGFDVPVLELRSLKLAIPAPSHFSGGTRRRGSPEHRDLCDLLTNGGEYHAAPLDLYAKLVGLPGKDGTAGKDVTALYAEGSLDRIAAYCMSDVVQTWLLFLRFRLTEGTLSPKGYARSLASAREDLPSLVGKRMGSAERKLLEPFWARCAPFFDGLETEKRRAIAAG
jgi:predicted PolB exonuclease-like 3'-5' exonuclease